MSYLTDDEQEWWAGLESGGQYTTVAGEPVTAPNTMNVSDLFEDIPGDPDNILMNIPKEWGFKVGDTLNIEVEDGAMTISKQPRNRFDLEQDIMECWRLTDDVKMIADDIADNCESVKGEDMDHILNLLNGVQALYEIKFNKLWRTFEDCVHNKDV